MRDGRRLAWPWGTPGHRDGRCRIREVTIIVIDRQHTGGLKGRAAQTARSMFWRLPYSLRRRLFHLLQPGRAAYYAKLRHGHDGPYSIKPMLERGCLFVHVPKCAGIAVSHALFGNRAGGHLALSNYQLALDARQYEALFKFTVVRNPYDRLLSAYRFLAGGGMSVQDAAWAAQTLPGYKCFSDFVERWLTPERADGVLHFRPQVCFLRIPGQRHIAVDFVARHENLPSDFRRLCERLKAGDIPLERHNPSSPPDTDYRVSYTDRARQIAAQVYHEDLEQLGYTFDGPTSRGFD